MAPLKQWFTIRSGERELFLGFPLKKCSDSVSGEI